MRRTITIVVVGLIGLAACAADAPTAGPSLIESVGNECDLDVVDDVLVLDLQGETDATGADLETVECVLRGFKVPNELRVEVNTNTRAADGTRVASYDDVRVEWGYHPDTGIRAEFSLREN